MIVRKLFVVAVTAILASEAEAQTSKCRAADSVSSGLIDELKFWVTTTDPELVNDRTNIFIIPVVSTSQITLVSDATTCQKLVTAYSQLPGGHVPPNLYVVKMGNKNFAVLDPTDLAGEHRIVMIFDSKYKRVGGWTGN